jgi:hypothetical protein
MKRLQIVIVAILPLLWGGCASRYQAARGPVTIPTHEQFLFAASKDAAPPPPVVYAREGLLDKLDDINLTLESIEANLPEKSEE